MERSIRNSQSRCRVWIALKRGVSSPGEGHLPGPAVLVEPAEEGTMSARQARRYVAAFNRAAASQGRPVRAVALPVAVRYEGDPVPGQPLELTVESGLVELFACIVRKAGEKRIPPRH